VRAPNPTTRSPKPTCVRPRRRSPSTVTSCSTAPVHGTYPRDRGKTTRYYRSLFSVENSRNRRQSRVRRRSLRLAVAVDPTPREGPPVSSLSRARRRARSRARASAVSNARSRVARGRGATRTVRRAKIVPRFKLVRPELVSPRLQVLSARFRRVRGAVFAVEAHGARLGGGGGGERVGAARASADGARPP